MDAAESTKPLLRPHQVENLEEEKRRLSMMIDPRTPDFIANQIQDKPQIRRQLQSVVKMLDDQGPKPIPTEERDVLTRREAELRNELQATMLTQAEIRKNPPGAATRLINWEKKYKNHVMEWKNIRLRMAASGMLDSGRDTANLEAFRPAGGSREMNMDNAQIPGTEYFMDENPRSVVLDDLELNTLEAIDPELRQQLVGLNADQRTMVKQIVGEVIEKTAETVSVQGGTVDNPGNAKFTCGAVTPKGVCKSAVKNEGERCRWHKEA